MHSVPFLLAAGAAPPFFAEVAALLVASAIVAYVCSRLGITPIVSFLITGALIGPQVLGLVKNPALIEGAAEIGVVLLLFTIGIARPRGKVFACCAATMPGGTNCRSPGSIALGCWWWPMTISK